MNESIRVGFFAVPQKNVEELLRLDEQWGRAFDERRDDHESIKRELYRRAAAVAPHRAELAYESILSCPFGALSEYVRHRILRVRDLGPRSAEEAGAMLREIEKHESRLGVNKVIEEMSTYWSGGSADELRRLYATFKETLAAAVTSGAGFVWVWYDDGAEARLAEEHRAREELGRKAGVYAQRLAAVANLDHPGFFVVPAAHIAELASLHARWQEVFDRRDEDHPLLANELYRAASAVAVHRVELHGEAVAQAFSRLPRLMGWICTEPKRAVFGPDDARELADDLAFRLSLWNDDENRLIRSFSPQKTPDPAYGAVYAALKEVLTEAVRRDHGMAWAMWSEDAEAEAEADERRLRALGPDPGKQRIRRPDPREVEADAAAFDDWIEKKRLERMADENARSTIFGHVLLFQLRADDIESVRAAARAGLERAAAPYRTRRRKARVEDFLDEIYALLRQRALSTVELTKGGEHKVLRALHERLQESGAEVLEPTSVYTPEGAGALREAILAWQREQGGEDAALGRLGADSEIMLRVGRRAYRALLRELGTAARHRHGLAWFLDGRVHSRPLRK